MWDMLTILEVHGQISARAFCAFARLLGELAADPHG
jgi:hypothetical protein